MISRGTLLPKKGVNMLQKIIEKTKAKKHGSQYLGHCPAHDDKSPSLSIKQDGEKILLHCHAGCAYEDIASALDIREKNHQRSNEYQSESFKRIWGEIESINTRPENAASRYLKQRGINSDVFPSTLGFIRELKYSEKGKTSFHPALVGKITNSEGFLKGVMRTYITEDGYKASVDTPKKCLGEIKGCGVRLGNIVGPVVHITEGIETGLAIYAAINQPVIAALNAGNQKTLEFESCIKEVHMWPDKDLSLTGQRESELAAEAFMAKGLKVILHASNLDIPEGQSSIDWLDIKNELGDEHLLQELNKHTELFGWNGPVEPIAVPITTPPEFDASLMPSPFKENCLDIAERLGVPVEMVLFPMLAGFGSLIGRKLAVHPNQKDKSWYEHPTFWCMTVGRPSIKKSPAQNYGLSPLSAVASKFIKEYQDQKEDIKVRRDMLDKKYKNLLKELDKKNQTDKGEFALQMELVETQKLIDELPDGPLRFTSSDSTMEMLCHLLSKNERGIALVRDELAGWILGMRKSGREGEREFFLEAWTGQGAFDQDRVGRGHIHVDNPRVTVIGSTQPSKAEPLVNPSLSDFVDDGLVQRFQFLLSYDGNPGSASIDREENLDAKNKVNEVFDAFLNPVFNSKLELRGYATLIGFDQSASPLYKNWVLDLEAKMKVLDSSEFLLESHLGKYRNLVPKLGLVIECIRNYESIESMTSISEDSTRKAIAICDFLEKHARNFYSSTNKAPYITAKSLSNHIKSGKLTDGMTLRELSRKHWKGTKNREQLDMALSVLEESNWIKIMSVKSDTGRPSEVIRIHPDALN